MTTDKKTYAMWHPGKTETGHGTFIQHELGFAKDRNDAKVIAMGLVRAMDLPEMYLVEEPGTLVFYDWSSKKSG